MSATIDGKAWSAGVDGPAGAFAMSVTGSRRELNGSSHLTITGTRTDGKTGYGVTLSLQSRKGFPLGTYPVRSNGGIEAASAQYQLDQDPARDGVSGMVVLNAITDDSASGTFEFVAEDDDGKRSTIAGGRFTAPIREL